MKKIIVSVVFIVLLFYVLVNHNIGPYSGVYDFEQNPNLVLKINDNNTFIIDNVIGKTSEKIKGKYTISDNNIVLVPDKENLDKSISETLFGKIEGSRIEMITLNGEFIKR